MGITGLLPIVKKILRKSHISKYSGSRIGIDGHAWIHRVLPSIATLLYNKQPVDRHLGILLTRLSPLMEHSITPIFVFDGDFLVSKSKTVEQRRATREKYKLEIESSLRRNDPEKARDLMKRCVEVTPELLCSILKILQSNGIEFIVSPYEADAQLYFLQKSGYIHHILTEDSDLIVYGAKNVLYKFDGSHVEEYNSSLLHLCRDKHFQENILDICILSGCDYVDSIRGVGLITAHEKLKETGSVKKFVEYMRQVRKVVPEDYLEQFNKAKATFLHHIVYNPYTLKRQFLTDPVENDNDYEFLGTLENIPVSFEMKIGGSVSIDRHFQPVNVDEPFLSPIEQQM